MYLQLHQNLDAQFIYYGQQICTFVPDSFPLRQYLEPIRFGLCHSVRTPRTGMGNWDGEDGTMIKLLAQNKEGWATQGARD